MRLGYAVLLLLMPGCFEGDEPERVAVTPPPMAEPAPTNAVPSAPPLPARLASSVASHGLAWSDCRFHDQALFYKHEWASDLVPSEYRQENLQAGNIGSAALEFMDCSGVSIANDTFLGPGRLSYLGVRVEPPSELQGNGTDLYLIAFLTDQDGLMTRIGNTSFPLRHATLTEEGSTLAATSEGYALSSTMVNPMDQGLNSTWQTRFHWKHGNLFCWADAHRTVSQEQLYEVIMEGRTGSPEILAGPADRLAGAGTQGVYSGFMEAPHCR